MNEQQTQPKTKSYELGLILKADKNDQVILENYQALKQKIEKLDISITSEDQWGRKKLAYVIEKNDYGFYFILTFQTVPNHISELKKTLGLNEEVLRYMITKL